MKTYLMNLKRREDRLNELKLSSPWLFDNPELEIVTSIDGKSVKSPNCWDAGNGAWGCYQTHLHCMQMALTDGIEECLILEDDCVFIPEFQQKFNEAYSELPKSWDMLYLGYQVLETKECPPEEFSEHLARVGNCNRTHAILYSKSGLEKIVPRIEDLTCRKPKHHIDHWLGELTKEQSAGKRLLNAFFVYPKPIVGQRAGKSDINGKNLKERFWGMSGVLAPMQEEWFTITGSSVGWGEIGLGGQLGYEGKEVSPKEVGEYSISAHAPADVTFVLNRKSVLCGMMNDTAGNRSVRFTLNGNDIGVISGGGSRTDEVTIEPGEYTVTMESVDGNNGGCHSVVLLKEC